MAINARTFNPRKKVNYAVEIDGIEVALVTAFKEPDVEVSVANHAGAGTLVDVKTASRMKVGEATLTKAVRADTADNAAWGWLTTAVDPEGVGAAPEVYKKDITVVEYSRDGRYAYVTVLVNAWVSKVEGKQHDGTDDDLAENITLQCDYMRRLY